jgi:serine/threonine protein kinase
VRKSDNLELAVKVISQRFVAQGHREAQILEMCREHPNIVKLIDVLQVLIVSQNYEVFKNKFQDRFHIYLILELLRGPELLTKIRHAKHFTEQEASRIFRKIVSAVSFVHKKGAVHRDLKPEASMV